MRGCGGAHLALTVENEGHRRIVIDPDLHILLGVAGCRGRRFGLLTFCSRLAVGTIPPGEERTFLLDLGTPFEAELASTSLADDSSLRTPWHDIPGMQWAVTAGLLRAEGSPIRRGTQRQPPDGTVEARRVGSHMAAGMRHDVAVATTALMQRPLLKAAILVTLAVSCTRGTTTTASPFPPNSPSPEPPHGQRVTDFSSFENALEAAGFAVRAGERSGNFFVPVPGRRLFIDHVPVTTYEYPSETALDEWRSAVNRRGDHLPSPDGGIAIVQGTPPRFYSAGNLLVLYYGDKRRTQNALDLVLGRPFAGL